MHAIIASTPAFTGEQKIQASIPHICQKTAEYNLLQTV
jgi:hypothetical protein